MSGTKLNGRVAIVTGGASGLGRAIAERFLAEGARVTICDVDQEHGRAVADAGGGNALFHRLDVRDDEQWAAAVAETISRFGGFDVLINNAGISIPGTIAETDDASWQRTMDVNLTGTFLGCRHAVRAMTQNGGAIINIASARGQRTSSRQLAYCASKAAILSMTESVALFCAEQDLPIRSNAICPGIIDTPILDHVRSEMGGGEETENLLRQMQPIGRLGKPEDVASMAAFLASDEANFITGATMNVDGGFRIKDR